MGKFGKETKILLLAITTICVISFLLATGISFLLAKGFQQELLLHDYGVSGYQLNHTEKLLISAFTAQPNESDISRGKNALASIGYSSATSMQLLPMVQNYRNQIMWCLFLLLLFSFGTIYFALFLYLNRQHKAIREAEGKIREFLDGNTMSRIECTQAGDWYSLFHNVNEMAAILSAHVRVGDVITLSINGKEQAVTVAGILSDSPLAREEGTETIFCSEKTFVALTGQTGYTIIDVQFQNGASIEDVKDIENIFTDGGVVFTEQLSQVQQQRNLYSAVAVLVYGFLSIIVAITIFHIMNTINMGVIAKTKQYGTMRAIGMSNQQLIKMIVAEAMTYAVSGMILGCIIGLPMHWVVFASLITNFWGTAWSIPIFPLALIIGIVLFTSFLAVRSPAKRLHDRAIVDIIKSQQ